MRRQWWWILVPFAALASANPGRGGDLPAGADAPAEKTVAPGDPARALATAIDRHVAAKWAEAQIEPAPLADDAEFLRRVALDLTGKIPTVAEAREFLDDPAPDKRARLVDRLLDSPAYVAHFTNLWRSLLLPQSNDQIQARFFAPEFEAWLREQVVADVRYDRLVREILTTKLAATSGPGRSPFNQTGKPTASAFYYTRGGKPEELAAASARAFLGVRLECAQCHDHPFARWSRDEFWGFAAFFAGLQRQGPENAIVPIRELPDRRELAIPGSDRVVQAAFLGGGEPRWSYDSGPRATLADWLTAPDNPFFARAAANRLWAQLFGIGLVDPADDLGEENPPSHPELLDELAREFAASGFDVKFLLRALTASRAYQLASASDSAGPADDPRLFARREPKGMTPEQLFDSLSQAAGLPSGTIDPRMAARNQNSPRAAFLDKFAAQGDRPTERETSILQALSMMHGNLVVNATDPARGETLGAIVSAPFLDTAGRIEALYLATLTRRPGPEELARLVAYVDGGGPAGDPAKALADVFWSLLNSAEFKLNH